MKQTKISVGILGATGLVGNCFFQLLQNHPQLVVKALAASPRSVGRRMEGQEIESCDANLSCTYLFSAMKACVAGTIEEKHARDGALVFSNARSHRWNPAVPLVIPEVNPEALDLVESQPWRGGIVTTPNCVVVPLCIALKPLVDRFGVEAVKVVSFQAISGAGQNGLSAFEIQDNVVPYIEGEQEKIEKEPFKIFGWERDEVAISAQCVRVPVTHGHTLAVSVKLSSGASVDEVEAALGERCSMHGSAALPQPRLHRELDGGMGVHVGQVERCPALGFRFIVMAHNLIRGSAGNAIRTAETYAARVLL